MNYLQIYNNLIERANGRVLKDSHENHHIIPKCMGGSDTRENLVKLTPEEHFLAHLLLIRIYPLESKLVYAAHIMCTHPNGKRNNNKMYGWLRRKVSEANKTKVFSKEARAKISKAKLGKPSPLRGRKLSEETKRKISAKKKNCVSNNLGKTFSAEIRKKMSDSHKRRFKIIC